MIDSDTGFAVGSAVWFAYSLFGWDYFRRGRDLSRKQRSFPIFVHGGSALFAVAGAFVVRGYWPLVLFVVATIAIVDYTIRKHTHFCPSCAALVFRPESPNCPRCGSLL
jgi:hypothetical protein